MLAYHHHFCMSAKYLVIPSSPTILQKSKIIVHIVMHAYSGGLGCKVSTKKIMCICGTYVIGAYVSIVGFNSCEIVENSDGHRFNK
jgi:hypothetical protein